MEKRHVSSHHMSHSTKKDAKIKRPFRASIPIQLVKQHIVTACCSFLLSISLTVGRLIYYPPPYISRSCKAPARANSASETYHSQSPCSLFAPIVSGALISTIGYSVPFM